MDFRLESAIDEYLLQENLTDNVDIISIAGAAKDLNDGSMGNAVEGQLALSKKLHDVQTIILMNHTDCGGYGGRAAFESIEAERDNHASELTKAAEKLAVEYPDVEIKKILADIKEDETIEILTVT